MLSINSDYRLETQSVSQSVVTISYLMKQLNEMTVRPLAGLGWPGTNYDKTPGGRGRTGATAEHRRNYPTWHRSRHPAATLTSPVAPDTEEGCQTGYLSWSYLSYLSYGPVPSPSPGLSLIVICSTGKVVLIRILHSPLLVLFGFLALLALVRVLVPSSRVIPGY